MRGTAHIPSSFVDARGSQYGLSIPEQLVIGAALRKLGGTLRVPPHRRSTRRLHHRRHTRGVRTRRRLERLETDTARALGAAATRKSAEHGTKRLCLGHEGMGEEHPALRASPARIALRVCGAIRACWHGVPSEGTEGALALQRH